MISDRAVVVMGKLPRPGRVKTRLTSALSPEEAAALYRCFLEDVLESVASWARSAHGSAAFAYVGEVPDDQAWAQDLCPSPVGAFPQRGADLGSRIEGARTDAQAQRVVVIGADSPTLGRRRLESAFARLQQGTAVVGPVHDGGYDLIGFWGPQPQLLRDVAWSTDRVLEQTKARARWGQIRLVELDPSYDVDHPEDLARLGADPELPRARRTHAFLRQRSWV